MAIDPRGFNRVSMADTCSVWNVLSSDLLYQTASSAGCTFCCTGFVNYECLLKPRKKPNAYDIELQKRLTTARKAGRFQLFSLEIEDLQEVEILERRKKLGKGELSSIAFAKRTQQAFLTDDKNAFKLAIQVLPTDRVQTTPDLFCWLMFEQLLGDSDKQVVISQHESLNRPLREQFEDSYSLALQYRLASRAGTN
jgi:hypothetical protein